MCNIAKRKNNTSGVKGIGQEVHREEKEDGNISIYTYWRARIKKDGKEYTKNFDYNTEGLQAAKEWIKNMSLDVQGEYSIYNRPDENK